MRGIGLHSAESYEGRSVHRTMPRRRPGNAWELPYGRRRTKKHGAAGSLLRIHVSLNQQRPDDTVAF